MIERFTKFLGRVILRYLYSLHGPVLAPAASAPTLACAVISEPGEVGVDHSMNESTGKGRGGSTQIMIEQGMTP